MTITAGLLFLCTPIAVYDGDSLRCGGERVRLYAIDAPELSRCPRTRTCTPGDGQASKRHLAKLIGRQTVRCVAQGADRYRRTIGRCEAGGVDLSCAMVRDGFAVERYGRLRCVRSDDGGR